MLKTLYRLAQDGHEAHTNAVAAGVGLTPGTVTGTIKRMAERELVIHRPYRGIELTAAGRLLSLSVVRRHRIVERFLTDMLGYTYQDAERLAPQFEHQLPQEVEDRLFNALGSPETCPHGYQIPAPNAEELPLSMRLTQLNLGEAAVIALPKDLDSDVISFFESIGVRPGARVELRETEPVVLRVDGEDRTVGAQLAERIRVVPGVHNSDVVDILP